MSYLKPAQGRLGAHSAQGSRLRGLGAVNNGSSTPNCSTTDPATGQPYGEEGVYCTATMPPSPVMQAISNSATVAGGPKSALNYVSPQAAIAAGLDPTDVTTQWTQALSVFPTADAAIAAGIPAGVVTQLFVASRQFVKKQTPPVWPLLVAAAIGALIVNEMDRGGH